MELKPGYKLTEIGVIPQDWGVTSLSALSRSPMQNGLFFKPALKGAGVKLINVGDLFTCSPIDLDQLELFSASAKEIEKFSVDSDDLFFTRSSIVASGIAHCNIYISRNSDPVVFDSHVIRLRPDANRVDPLYLFRFCIGPVARRYFVSNAKTGTMTTIDQGVLGKCPVLMPSNAEQHAIAEALSDADALIESLDQLIVKKRQIKQGAMQELLTGKRRLPGFSGDWEDRSLFELAGGRKELFDDGDWIESEHITDDGIRLIQTGNIGVGAFVEKDDRKYISEASFVSLRCKEIKQGDLLICRLAEPAGRACVLPELGESKIITSVDVTIFRPPLSLAKRVFLANVFSTAHWFNEVSDRSGGTTHKRISRGSLGGIRVTIPKVDEQTAIATILSEMDTELVALESRLAKARQIKQGMMQELLTGRIRLL